MDLCVRYRGETLAIEIKVWRPEQPDPLKEGLMQIDGYLDGLGLSSGWLVIFDRRPTAPPLAERLSALPATTPAGREERGGLDPSLSAEDAFRLGGSSMRLRARVAAALRQYPLSANDTLRPEGATLPSTPPAVHGTLSV